MDLWHLVLNQYVLWNFGSTVLSTVGAPCFAAIYVGAGVAGSAGSLWWHSVCSMAHFSSLGASASLLGIIAVFAAYEPTARFKVVFDVSGYLTFSAWNGLIGLIVLDAVGLLRGWRFLDHAAHLSGAAVGLASWTLIRSRYGTAQSERDRLCLDGQYVFEGRFRDYKLDGDRGTVYSAAKTYRGEMLLDRRFLFHGKGALRNESNGSVFYGHFDRGHIDGVGLLCFENGKVFPAVFDRQRREFKVADPDSFGDGDLGDLLKGHVIMKDGSTDDRDQSNVSSSHKISETTKRDSDDAVTSSQSENGNDIDLENTEESEQNKKRPHSQYRVKGHE